MHVPIIQQYKSVLVVNDKKILNQKMQLKHNSCEMWETIKTFPFLSRKDVVSAKLGQTSKLLKCERKKEGNIEGFFSGPFFHLILHSSGRILHIFSSIYKQ